MHSFVLADALHQKLPTKFIETKLHFNLFLVSSISVSDLSSSLFIFCSISSLYLSLVLCLIFIHFPRVCVRCSSFQLRFSFGIKTTGWTELNCMHKIILETNFADIQTHVFRYWILPTKTFRPQKRRWRQVATMQLCRQEIFWQWSWIHFAASLVCTKPKSTLTLVWLCSSGGFKTTNSL